MNDEHMGGRALGTQDGPVCRLGVGPVSQGLGPVEEQISFVLAKLQPQVPE